MGETLGLASLITLITHATDVSSRKKEKKESIVEVLRKILHSLAK